MKISRIISIFLLIILFVAPLSASGSDKNIIYRTVGDDMVVFVKPRKMKNEKNSIATKPLEYDITLNNQSDSVAVTYTIVTKSNTLQVDSVAINDSLLFANERLYIEQNSNNRVYRLKFKLPINKFKETFCSENQLSLSVDNCRFFIPQKKQVKEAKICQEAVLLIELNKK